VDGTTRAGRLEVDEHSFAFGVLPRRRCHSSANTACLGPPSTDEVAVEGLTDGIGFALVVPRGRANHLDDVRNGRRLTYRLANDDVGSAARDGGVAKLRSFDMAFSSPSLVGGWRSARLERVRQKRF
jgi:hypothetical protein